MAEIIKNEPFAGLLGPRIKYELERKGINETDQNYMGEYLNELDARSSIFKYGLIGSAAMTGSGLANKLNPNLIGGNVGAGNVGSVAQKVHPITKVPFDAKGFPAFKSQYQMKMNPSDYLKSRGTHFKRASESLYSEAKGNPELASKFTAEELGLFEKGLTPSSYTWHHNQEPGLMQLVDREIHKATGHSGGFSIWGPSK